MLSDIAKDTSRPGRKRKPFDMAALQNARGEVSLGYRVLRNWDATAAHYGISKAAAHRLANDPNYRPSQATIDKVLATPRPQRNTISVRPCPSCAARGIIDSHADGLDCHGNGGTVVVLAPGETVTTPRGPWVSKALPEVAAMVRGLQLCLERKAGHAPALEVTS